MKLWICGPRRARLDLLILDSLRDSIAYDTQFLSYDSLPGKYQQTLMSMLLLWLFIPAVDVNAHSWTRSVSSLQTPNWLEPCSM